MNEPLFTTRREGDGRERRYLADPMGAVPTKPVRPAPSKAGLASTPFAPVVTG